MRIQRPICTACNEPMACESGSGMCSECRTDGMKETEINRRLAEFDERVKWGDKLQGYCSEDSPRSLISGIERQLDDEQMERYEKDVFESGCTHAEIIKLPARDRARVLAEIIIGEKE